MKSTIFSTALLALVLTACSDRATVSDDVATTPVADQPATDVPPATAPPLAAPIAPAPDSGDSRFDGYGDMRFGMSAEKTKTAWGGELNGAPGDGDTCYHLSPKWASTQAEFALMIESGKFVRYSTESNKHTAPGGGKVGMSADEISALYPNRVEEQPHKYTDGKYLRIKDTAGSNALLFETDAGGKVTEWRVGVTPQVDYVEGCS
ncbi:MAG: lectin [Pseudomonadota bacterium]|nr:lectin [Pseudomonadota bacterium]